MSRAQLLTALMIAACSAPVTPHDGGSADAGDDASAPFDAGAPDGGEWDAGEPDAGDDDAGMPDAGAPDASVPDGGAADAGSNMVRDRVLVILVQHAQNTMALPTVATMEQRLATVGANYEEYSYGRYGLTVDVVGWFTSTDPTNCINVGEAYTLADSQVDFRRYATVVVIVAMRPGCTFSAMASFGKILTSTPDGSAFFGLVRMSLPNAGVGTLTHEIGHTLGGVGQGHGIFYDCGTVPLADAGCTSVEYGDPYDVMSLGVGHFSARRKELLGWLGDGGIAHATASGRWTLEPFETATGGLKALAVPWFQGEPLYIEYRQPLGTDATFSANADVFQGALLRWGNVSRLIDATPPPGPYGPAPPTDAQLTPALHVGTSIVAPDTGRRVTVVSRDAGALVIDVAW